MHSCCDWKKASFVRSVIVALLIFGTIPFIFTRPFVGLMVWSWLGYMNPYRLTYGFAYSFPWVLIIAVITLVSVAASREDKRIPFTAVSVLLFLFLAWTGLATIFAVDSSAVGTFEEFAKTLVMVFVTFMLVKTRARMHWLVWMIVVSLGFYGVKGGVFTALGGGASHVLGPSGSFIGDNNAIALALCMVLPLMRYLQLHAARKAVRVGLGAAMLLTAIAVLGTYSRGGLIALAIVALALLVKGRRRVAVTLFFGVVALTAYHFMPPQWIARMGTLQDPTQVNSAETRIQSWKFAANVAFHHPFVGGGFNDYKSERLWEAYGPPDARPRAIHSVYFRVLSEQGFPGLFLFLGLLAASWLNCRSVRKKTRASLDQRWAYDLASMLQVSLVAFVVSGALLPMTYFDLTYQLMALCALLALYVRNAVTESPALSPAKALPRELGHPSRVHRAMSEQ